MTMQRSKLLALVFLIGTLIVGGAIGFTVDRLLVRNACKNMTDRKSLRRTLADRLELTPTQRVAVDSILDKRHRDMNAVYDVVRPQIQPKLDSIRAAARVEISKVLDARQQARFQQMIEESKRAEAQKK
jgi:Spy/CpxP family protein refolding chaperone